VTRQQFFVTTSSSSAAEKNHIKKFWKHWFIVFVTICIFSGLFFLNQKENNTYILKALELKGSVKEGDTLFKMNCVGCHGVTARGFLGPDLHSITQRLDDKKIIKQVIEGQTPPMPSFDIDPQNMSNLLTYLHTLR
tara:strand:- start:1813 stop:2220 length:408 start_codon:yes stop_codon:yes gene_type:complete